MIFAGGGKIVFMLGWLGVLWLGRVSEGGGDTVCGAVGEADEADGEVAAGSAAVDLDDQ